MALRYSLLLPVIAFSSSLASPLQSKALVTSEGFRMLSSFNIHVNKMAGEGGETV
jgi:hypothetical protein